MSAHPSPGPSTQSLSSSRNKQKPLTIGIAAGAEDAKYQAKYKDLKRKVKEIETDNDKLHFKVLQAKRSIQRMKLERAILYERLAGTPTPIDVQSRHGGPPPMHHGPGAPVHPPFSRSHSGSHHYHEIGDNHPSIESERPMSDYPSHDRPRMVSGPDGRPVSVMAPMGPGVAPPSHMSGMSPPRRSSGGQGHESARHLQHLPPMPPPGHHAHSRPHVSPTMHHSHSGSSHQRTRSHSSSRSRAHHQPYIPGHLHQYPEGSMPVQQVMHSPPVPERERSRRHDNHESLGSHGDPHQHGRLSSFMPRLSPPPGSSSRVHHHQRMSPGPYREDPYDRQSGMESERERDWEREHRDRERDRSRDHVRNRDSHMVSPQLGHRSRQPMDRGEPLGSSRMREEPVYYRDPLPGAGGYAMPSRSGSPVSGSGSGSGNGAADGPSRPDSRHYYEQHDRTRSYRLRPANPPNEDMDFVHEDGRSLSSRDRGGGGGGNFPPSEQSRSSLDSRKRGRNDMDVDSDDAGEGPVYGSGRAPEDRGKRYHREHRRSVDNQEDGRMGPP
ncbi:hypothetical protein D9615_000622 [Tricholomella constricta]|uniref:INO80 complex subunit F domain-containing protein n=1 Tax=Tricholomella constricta TaxID=117010 RepID=A0A8H5HR26_9AGAR|nr:hypothetical protein D9615_000622 [Tricholomella constricta]